MSQAKAGDTVRVHYTGKLDDGTQFDSSAGRDPFEFALGGDKVIQGFNKAVEGMIVGENKTVTIQPEDAYGPRHDQLVRDVPMSQLPGDMQPAVGMQLRGETRDGQHMLFTVTAVTDTSITVDGNHPLAGRALKYDIELVEIV